MSGPVVAIALDPRRRLRADRVHPRHHRPAVPAVRGDDRHLGADLGVQRAHAEPGALRAAAAAAKRETRGPLGAFFRGFNRWFGRATDGYVSTVPAPDPQVGAARWCCSSASPCSPACLGSRLPGGFLPDEDQGYFYVNVQLPAGRLARSAPPRVCDKIDAIFKETPGVKSYNTVVGFSLLSAGDHDLQRLLLRHAGGRGTSATTHEAHRRRDHRSDLNQRLGRAARGAGLRVLAARHPRHRHVGRRHVHARGPRRPRRRVPRREHGERSSPPRASVRSSRCVFTHASRRACRRSSPRSTATRC